LVLREVTRKPHHNASVVVCDGKEYASVSELAKSHGLLRNLVYKRLRLQWTPEQAVGLEPKPPRYRNADGSIRHHQWNNPQITSTGKKFAGSTEGRYLLYQITNSVNSKTYIGVTTSDLRTRLRGHRASARKGQSGALYNAMRKHGIDKFEIHLLRDDASNIEELLYQEVEAIEKYGTLKNGYNSAPGGSLGTAKPITVDGKYFESRGLAAEFYGISYAAFSLRIERLGWSPEEAAGLVKREKWQNHEIEFSHDGIDYQFNSLKQAAEFFGVDWKLAHDRNSKPNWTIQEVLELTPLSSEKTKYGGLKVEFEGVTYDSIAQFAETHQLKKGAVLHYMSTCKLTSEETYFVVSNDLQKELRKVKMKHKCTYSEAVKILKDQQA
jgi:predicted GIY-YIG superfamily endonuclease